MINSILKDQDIICISSIDWDFIWQGHQEIMTRFARNGNRVLFIENTGVRAPAIRDLGRIKNRILNWRKGVYGIRKIENGLYVYSPLVLPFPYLRFARYINKKLILATLSRWLRAVGFSEPIIWVFLPTGLSLDLINEINPKILIYYCIDSFQASSKDARKIMHTEELILTRADLVFVTSQELFKHCSGHNKNTHYFPFGVNIENFTMAINEERATPKDISGIKHPIAGYIGGIHRWIDFDLIKEIADKNRDISFVFCGPIQTDIAKVNASPNVVFLGQKNTEDLPLYVKEFDVALIPYRLTEYTKNVYPTKLNEYLSMGKRVVSTALPEVRRFNTENNGVVKISANYQEFSNNIRDALNMPGSKEETEFAASVAQKNSWGDRIKEMSSLIEVIMAERVSQKEKYWKGNLAKFYARTRMKLIPIALAALVIYSIIFHTPLIWMLGKPLLIKDMLHKADAIIALGGGVGESGKAGQGHEEKVDTAASLYKEGYAKKILYLSGYQYIMKEANVMKVLSIASGINEYDILIDDSPVNTYDMMICLKKVAKANGWHNIIMVSSPYHMLRLKLICKKNLRGINVMFYPVEYTNYYGSPDSSVRPRHIRGILQEYLAIAYYKLKGYI